MTVLGSIRFRNFSLPVQVTEANLSFIQDQTTIMVAWIKLEVLCLFNFLQWKIISGARAEYIRLSPVVIPIFLTVIFTTAGWRLATIIRGARSRLESPDSINHIQN